jgi:hypothetical protein
MDVISESIVYITQYNVFSHMNINNAILKIVNNIQKQVDDEQYVVKHLKILDKLRYFQNTLSVIPMNQKFQMCENVQDFLFFLIHYHTEDLTHLLRMVYVVLNFGIESKEFYNNSLMVSHDAYAKFIDFYLVDLYFNPMFEYRFSMFESELPKLIKCEYEDFCLYVLPKDDIIDEFEVEQTFQRLSEETESEQDLRIQRFICEKFENERRENERREYEYHEKMRCLNESRKVEECD